MSPERNFYIFAFIYFGLYFGNGEPDKSETVLDIISVCDICLL